MKLHFSHLGHIGLNLNQRKFLTSSSRYLSRNQSTVRTRIDDILKVCSLVYAQVDHWIGGCSNYLYVYKHFVKVGVAICKL